MTDQVFIILTIFKNIKQNNYKTYYSILIKIIKKNKYKNYKTYTT